MIYRDINATCLIWHINRFCCHFECQPPESSPSGTQLDFVLVGAVWSEDMFSEKNLHSPRLPYFPHLTTDLNVILVDYTILYDLPPCSDIMQESITDFHIAVDLTDVSSVYDYAGGRLVQRPDGGWSRDLFSQQQNSNQQQALEMYSCTSRNMINT